MSLRDNLNARAQDVLIVSQRPCVDFVGDSPGEGVPPAFAVLPFLRPFSSSLSVRTHSKSSATPRAPQSTTCVRLIHPSKRTRRVRVKLPHRIPHSLPIPIDLPYTATDPQAHTMRADGQGPVTLLESIIGICLTRSTSVPSCQTFEALCQCATSTCSFDRDRWELRSNSALPFLRELELRTKKTQGKYTLKNLRFDESTIRIVERHECSLLVRGVETLLDILLAC